MPIHFRIDNLARRVYTVATGVVTCEDLRDHMNADVAPEVAAYSEIIDLTDATTDLTANEVRILAEERKRIAATRQVAGPVAVIATDNLFFGMLRMFEVHTSEVRPIQVFRNPRDAESWLDSVEQATDQVLL